MPVAEEKMAKLWILRGAHEASGWNQLRKAYEDEKVEIIHLDAKVWAIIDAEEEPTGYQGLSASRPADGMYIDPNGTPLFLVGGRVATSAKEVVEGLGDGTAALRGDALRARAEVDRILAKVAQGGLQSLSLSFYCISI